MNYREHFPSPAFLCLCIYSTLCCTVNMNTAIHRINNTMTQGGAWSGDRDHKVKFISHRVPGELLQLEGLNTWGWILETIRETAPAPRKNSDVLKQTQTGYFCKMNTIALLKEEWDRCVVTNTQLLDCIHIMYLLALSVSSISWIDKWGISYQAKLLELLEIR